MSIANILKTRKLSISFEFFPPKTLAIEKVLFFFFFSLQEENADFSSVTFGAGGSTADKERTARQGRKAECQPGSHRGRTTAAQGYRKTA